MNLKFDASSPDSIAQLKAPTDERMMAFMYAHAGFNDESKEKLDEMMKINKLDLGRGIAMKDGYNLNLSENEMKRAQGALEHYQRLVKWARTRKREE